MNNASKLTSNNILCAYDFRPYKSLCDGYFFSIINLIFIKLFFNETKVGGGIGTLVKYILLSYP